MQPYTASGLSNSVQRLTALFMKVRYARGDWQRPTWQGRIVASNPPSSAENLFIVCLLVERRGQDKIQAEEPSISQQPKDAQVTGRQQIQSNLLQAVSLCCKQNASVTNSQNLGHESPCSISEDYFLRKHKSESSGHASLGKCNGA